MIAMGMTCIRFMLDIDLVIFTICIQEVWHDITMVMHMTCIQDLCCDMAMGTTYVQDLCTDIAMVMGMACM